MPKTTTRSNVGCPNVSSVSEPLRMKSCGHLTVAGSTHTRGRLTPARSSSCTAIPPITRQTEASVIDRGHQLDRHAADLQLLADVIHAGQGESFESAAAQVVEHVCAWSAWPVGFVYRVAGTGTEDPVSLDVVASRYEDTDDPGRFAQLRALVEREARDHGSGVAGRAHKTCRVVWVPNVSVDPAVDPDRLSVMTGIRGACAVPVIREGRVVAVLEFLSSDQLTPDATTTRLLEATAEMLASVLTSRNAV